MNDMLCSVSKTKDHIVILTSVELGPEEFCSIKKSSLEHTEMTDVVIGSEIIYCIIWLEMHSYHLIDVITLEGGLITIDVICVFLIYCLNIPVQNLGMKYIIMVKKTYILAFCKLQTMIGITRNTLILLQFHVADPAFS